MDNDLEMENTIIKEFGIAPKFKKEGLSIKFNDKEIPKRDQEYYHCRKDDVKFAIVEDKTGEVFFTMEFFKKGNPRAFGGEDAYQLQIIVVHKKEWRNKGIGTFYLNKLKNYVLKNNVHTLSILVNPDMDQFKIAKKDRIGKQALIEYYEKFSDENFSVETFG